MASVGLWVALSGAVALSPVAAGGGAATAPPRIRIEPVATLDTLLLTLGEPGSWAPRGTRLALMLDSSQVWVFDAEQPASPPRLAYGAGQRMRSCGWSPDGGWLLLLLGDRNPRGVHTLVAVPIDGGWPDTLRSEARLWLAFWGPDGNIHYRVGLDWLEVPPPRRWSPHASFVARPPPAFDLGAGLTLWFGRPDPRQVFELVCFATFRQDGRALQVLDALPDGSRYLVRISEGTSAALRLVDRDGRTVLDLRQAGIRFEPTALSGDGRMIMGTAAESVPEVELPENRLEAADAEGHWVAQIEGGEESSHAQLSRNGSFIAYRTLHGVRVGRLISVASTLGR